MHTPIQNEVHNYKSLQQRLQEEFPDTDDETIGDTLEGITNLHEMIAELIRSALEDHALTVGLKSRIDEMRDRLSRLEERKAKKRALALDAMVAADIKKLMQPDFTVSVRTGSPSIIIVSEDEIPDAFWTPQPAKLDRHGVLASLKSGQVVPGAVLSNASPNLSVRTK